MGLPALGLCLADSGLLRYRAQMSLIFAARVPLELISQILSALKPRADIEMWPSYESSGNQVFSPVFFFGLRIAIENQVFFARHNFNIAGIEQIVKTEALVLPFCDVVFVMEPEERVTWAVVGRAIVVLVTA
jgi:hypothetical protein